MILVDANLLVYAHIRDFNEHERARKWLDMQLNGATSVGLPWATLLAFLRLITNPRVFTRPASIANAWQQVNLWLSCENVWVPEPTPRHIEVLGKLLITQIVRANLIPDAHLAALAIEHGLLLCSNDGNFARFPDLRWNNPLQ